ncbi:MAG: hypothetical protein E7307_03630 [Butyrivibrio sp.]|nr:hypothetical protein [Butyrivibrio sp.]
MPFLYSIEEHKKDKHKYVMITGFDEGASDLVVPAEIDGYPVEAVGNHAFSGRGDLLTVSLPMSIKTLYGFAFHNCRKLRKISLFDSIDDYYDGVCRQCDSLKEVEITMVRGWYEVVRNFLADNDRTLRFILNLQDDSERNAGYPARSVLTFPEYVYDFNENTMARTIQFSIAGSGMFYRECVDRRSMDYRQYDRLFEKAVIDGGRIPEDIAIDRLLYPVELADDFRKAYEDHVRANAESILIRLVEESSDEPENIGTVKALLTYNNSDPKKNLLPSGAMDAAIKLSADKGLVQMSAVLMEAGRVSAEDQMFKL